MPKVEEIKVLNVDDTVLAVDAQSEEVKALVATYNEWNQDLANAQKDHAQLRAAVQALSQQIIHTIRLEKEKAAAEETAKVEAAKVEAAKVEAADNVTPIVPVPEVAPGEVTLVPAKEEVAPVVEAESLKDNTLIDPEVTE